MFDKSKVDKSISQNEALHHLQRAIEKCLKALLVFEDVDYKNSHDIRYLLICVTHQLPPIESIVKYANEINKWEAVTCDSAYELKDENIFYAVAMDYCTLYNFVTNILSD